MAQPPLLLRINQGPKSGSCFECSPSRITTIGRSSRNTLQIRDAGISQRRHLYFKWTDPEWIVTDGGSSNGTIVNDVGIAANKGVFLKTGDVIKIGEDTTITVETPLTFSVSDKAKAATKAKAASKSKRVAPTKILSPQAENQQGTVISSIQGSKGGERNLGEMTVKEWLEHLMEKTPKYLHQVSESLIQEMELESKQFDEYIYSLMADAKTENHLEGTTTHV